MKNKSRITSTLVTYIRANMNNSTENEIFLNLPRTTVRCNNRDGRMRMKHEWSDGTL